MEEHDEDDGVSKSKGSVDVRNVSSISVRGCYSDIHLDYIRALIYGYKQVSYEL